MTLSASASLPNTLTTVHGADAVVSCSVAMGTSPAKVALIGDQNRYSPLKGLKHKATFTQTADAGKEPLTGQEQ